MTLEQIIRDIRAIDVELATLEKRYGLLSARFYQSYRRGEKEQNRDFIMRASYCETKSERESQYRQLAHD